MKFYCPLTFSNEKNKLFIHVNIERFNFSQPFKVKSDLSFKFDPCSKAFTRTFNFRGNACYRVKAEANHKALTGGRVQGSNLKVGSHFTLKGCEKLNPSMLTCKNNLFFSFENVSGQ